jgi:hypothetical protein
MSIQPLPTFATSITGPATVIANQSNVTYSVPSTSGMQYNWTVPPGATIVSGQGTNTIVVNFGSSSGSVSVTQTNPLGQTSSINIPITVSPTTSSRSIQEAAAWSVYPNPSKGEYYLENNNAAGKLISIEVMDAAGKTIQRIEPQVMSTGAVKVMTETSQAGVYFLKVQVDEIQFIKKVIVE